MEHSEVVDLPHGEFEVVWIGNPLGAGSRASTLTKGRVGKITTERDVEDERLVSEELAHWARPGGEECRGSGPGIWVGSLVGDIVWNATSGEEPDSDSIVVPEGGVYTSTSEIQAESVTVRVGVFDTAARVEIDVGIASGGFDDPSERGITDELSSIVVLTGGVKSAAGQGVEGRLVGSRVLSTLDHVDFTTCGPVISIRPVCGPDGAAIRHLKDIGDEETMAIFVLGVDTNAIPLLSFLQLSGVVDFHDSDAIWANVSEPLAERSTGVHVVDCSVSWVVKCHEFPFVEEGLALGFIDEIPGLALFFG